MSWSKYYTYPVDNSFSYNETVLLEEISIQKNILEIYSFNKPDDINLNDFYKMDNIIKSDIVYPYVEGKTKPYDAGYINKNYSLSPDNKTNTGYINNNYSTPLDIDDKRRSFDTMYIHNNYSLKNNLKSTECITEYHEAIN